MNLAADFLSCLPAKAEGFRMRPLGVDAYLIEITITKELATGRNTPEQNPLQRAIKRREKAILAALGFRAGSVAVAAGLCAGQMVVLDPDGREIETHRFDLPQEWADLLGLIDLGSPIPEDFNLELVISTERPHQIVRVRQTTADDVRRAL